MGVYHVIITLFLLWKDTTCQEAAVYSIQVNDDVSVQEGLCVTIPCNFTADNRRTFTSSTGYWIKYVYKTVASNDKSATAVKPNFHLTGNPNIGDCTLTITGARKEDDGKYYFRFEESPSSSVKYSYTSLMVSVKVTDIIHQEADGYRIQVYCDVTVQEGLCVTIPCSFMANNIKQFTNSRGYWRDHGSDDIVASNNISVTGVKSNFQLTGNPNTGNCSLTITSARREDSGTYYFRFEETPDSTIKYSYKLSKTTVRVTALSRKPEIYIPRNITAGQEVTLTCSFPVTCPGLSPTFQWTKGDQNMCKDSTVTFTPTRSDNKKPMTCKVTLPNVTPTQTSINLDVQYPQIITITGEIKALRSQPPASQTDVKRIPKTETVTVLEGDSLRLTCSVDSNPAANVTWKKGGDDVPSSATGQGLELSLTDIQSSAADTYYCVAESEHGEINQSVTLIVQYQPRKPVVSISSSTGGPLEASQSVITNEDGGLSINCSVDSNPAAVLSWIKGEHKDSNNRIAEGITWLLVKITSSEAGIYRCLARNKYGSSETRIQINRKPDPPSITITREVEEYRYQKL
ncbi:sialic acid-binding Ig-like lectin 13 [Pseudophryne corroboree]|uniref:sialic acid-binding Ig-like lectin 13 n=1 Tax=Pseudophryne corroboree TaxID=495146 RepID=UPI0030820753